FDHFSVFHFAEGHFPFFQRPHPSNYVADIKATRSQQPDHFFPYRPVMTEATLNTYVFLYDGVQRKADRLWPPTHLNYLTVRSHPFDRTPQCIADPCGVYHAVCAHAVQFPRPSVCAIGERLNPVSRSNVQPYMVTFQTYDPYLGTS